MEIKELTIIMLPNEVAFSFKIDPNPPKALVATKRTPEFLFFSEGFLKLEKD
ncbi:hypothetical protein GW750_06180 [bacterium]|nr:hypothetical protein [bacterium]